MKRLLIAAAFVAAFSVGAAAQSYPSRPVTLIAPFPAGGPLDTIARIISEPMRIALGQPVIIENVTGAGGNIGTARVARSAPDGYTIGMGQWSTHVVNPITYSLQYNVLTDFEPVALLTITPQLIIARKDFPAKDIKELVAWLKANPGKATSGTVGAAGGAQVATIYFQQAVGTSFQFVPYKGGGPAVQDMISGRLDVMLDQAANALGHVQAGSVRAYAVMAKDRWLACALGAQGHAEGRDRQAQRRGYGGAGRSGRKAAARCGWPRRLAARATDARSACGVSYGRNREVVADRARLQGEGGIDGITQWGRVRRGPAPRAA